MKKVILVAAVALLGLTACSTLTGTTPSTSSSTTNAFTGATTMTGVNQNDGQAAGAALRALYAQYKADGKYDYTNLNNAMNAIQLVKSCQNLKNNAKDSDYWKSFATGLILGSNNLVTEKISDTVTEQLNTLVQNVDTSKMESASNSTISAIQSASETASSISNILSLFK